MSAPSETFRRADGESTGRDHAVQKLDGRLRDLLAGKKILMTGVTGFIGEQLFWKILTELPDTTPAVLVRKKRSQDAWERMVAVVKKDIFKDLRDSAGGPEELLEARVEVLEGDLPRAGAAGRRPGRALRRRRVASTRRSTRPSTPTCSAPGRCSSGIEAGPTSAGHGRDPTTCTSPRRTSGAGGADRSPRARSTTPSTRRGGRGRLAMRERIEDASRSPNVLEKLRKQAEREHGRAGPLTAANETERAGGSGSGRAGKAGTERARTLGWTDCLHVHQVDGRARRRR